MYGALLDAPAPEEAPLQLLPCRFWHGFGAELSYFEDQWPSATVVRPGGLCEPVCRVPTCADREGDAGRHH